MCRRINMFFCIFLPPCLLGKADGRVAQQHDQMCDVQSRAKRGRLLFKYISEQVFFAWLKDIAECPRTPLAVGVLSVVCQTICAPDRQAANVRTGPEPRLAHSVLHCLSVSVCPGFDHVWLWSESHMNTHQHPAHAGSLYTHSHHTHGRLKSLALPHRSVLPPKTCVSPHLLRSRWAATCGRNNMFFFGVR